MKKPFEELCSLIDEFWKQHEEPLKPGPRPEYQDDFYLKLYWYGILSRFIGRNNDRSGSFCPCERIDVGTLGKLQFWKDN